MPASAPSPGSTGTADELLLDGQEPLAFDHLVIAAGSSTNYFGVDGRRRARLPAVLARRRRPAAQPRPRAVRGRRPRPVGRSTTARSPSSWSAAGRPVSSCRARMAELFDKVLRKDFAHLRVDRARVVLVEMGDALLSPFQARSRRHAIDALRRRGVDVRLATTVESVARRPRRARGRRAGRRPRP